MTPSINNTIFVHRQKNNSKGTFGYLQVLSDICIYSCATLEPANTDGKTNHLVLPGLYRLSWTYSPKFHRLMPFINVPDRVGIRIHAGNSYKDTCGCLVVGERSRSCDWQLTFSQRTLTCLFDVLKMCDIQFIEYINEFQDLSFQRSLNL